MSKPFSNQAIIGGAILSVFGIFSLGAVVISTLVPQPVALKPDPVASAFANIHLEAESAIVYDPEAKEILFAKAPDTPRPIASITKVMTALVAKDLLDGNATVAITNSALSKAGESSLRAGESWQLDDLIDFTLVSSSNDGAAAIAETVSREQNADFVALMNMRARELGMNQSQFVNETGLDLDPHTIGSLSTASDIAKLFAHILKTHPGLLSATQRSDVSKRSLDSQTHTADNTNEIVSEIPGILASKTGYTKNAHGNLAVAFDRGLRQPIIVVVLGSSEQGRFRDVETLIQATFKATSDSAGNTL